jgi:hypothetical protein
MSPRCGPPGAERVGTVASVRDLSLAAVRNMGKESAVSTIVIILIVVIVVLIALGGMLYLRHQRSERLRTDFGSEYDRKVADSSSRSAGEKELTERQKRHRSMDIHPLDREERDSYRTSWEHLQGQFVDSPATAVREADTLVVAIMRKRGYPTDNFDQRADDISVEHPEVVQHYRAAHKVAMAQEKGDAGTEELRKAAISYRSLVQALLEDKPEANDRNGSSNTSDRTRQKSEQQPEQRSEKRSRDRSEPRAEQSSTDDRSKA